MTEITRRGMLSTLAAAPVAAPALMNDTAAKLAGVGDVLQSSGGMEAAVASSESHIYEVLAKVGLPQWKKDEIWHQERSIHSLDPDIAEMRSLSLSAKINKQRRRNYDARIKGYTERGSWAGAKEAFCNRHNIPMWF